MQIIHLSETLNQYRQLDNLPAADVIIHSGGSTFAEIGEEGSDFIFYLHQKEQIQKQKNPYRYKNV